MKKTLVFVLVAAMLASLCAVNASAYFVKPANSGNVRINTYVAATEWKPDGVIDVENGEYFEMPFTKADVSVGYQSMSGKWDGNPDPAAEMLIENQINSLKFYSSWNGSGMVYFAATWKPAIYKQTLTSAYNPANGKSLGNVGSGDDFACNLSVCINTTGDIHKQTKSPLSGTNNNWMYMTYARGLEDGNNTNPESMPFDGMFAGSYDGQMGCTNTYNPIGLRDFYVGYDLDAGTVLYEISFPTKEGWNKDVCKDGDEVYMNFEMICGTDDYAAFTGDHYLMSFGDFGFFLPNQEAFPDNNSAIVVFHNGQPEGWGAGEPADDETTAADTTAADDETTVADETTAEETTAKPAPVNPVTADITVLCLAAAASAIAIISKKRK